MAKFKICPSCKEKNSPSYFECLNCGTDLTSVPITEDVPALVEAPVCTQSESLKMSEYVRICECGHINSFASRKCEKCGEDISDSNPVLYSAAVQKKWFLDSIDGAHSFEFSDGEHIVGREAELHDYLFDKSYVSRNHCQIVLKNGDLYINNLSHTNQTFVNNQMISAETKLQENDEIGLGGKQVNGSRQNLAAYFIVKLK